MKLLPLSALLACAFATAACGGKPPSVSKSFSFAVTGDPGEPIANAQLIVNAKPVATTDAQGVAQVTLTGHEGDAFDISVRCPDEFQSPAHPTRVSIQRSAGAKRTEYTATCPRKTRTIVLVVNGMKGYRLPVIQLGRTIGETDDSGVASILLHAEPNDQFEVMLDTSAPENALLRPRNPVATFATKDVDDILVFDPQLTVAPKPRATTSRHHVPLPTPLPVRIQ